MVSPVFGGTVVGISSMSGLSSSSCLRWCLMCLLIIFSCGMCFIILLSFVFLLREKFYQQQN